MKRVIVALLALCLAQTAGAADLRIGLLRLENDPRYDEDFAYARIELRPLGDVSAAVRMAISDMEMLTDARGFTPVLSEAAVGDGELQEAARAMVDEGVTHLVVDLPAVEVDALAAALADTPVTILNTTAPDDADATCSITRSDSIGAYVSSILVTFAVSGIEMFCPNGMILNGAVVTRSLTTADGRDHRDFFTIAQRCIISDVSLFNSEHGMRK